MPKLPHSCVLGLQPAAAVTSLQLTTEAQGARLLMGGARRCGLWVVGKQLVEDVQDGTELNQATAGAKGTGALHALDGPGCLATSGSTHLGTKLHKVGGRRGSPAHASGRTCPTAQHPTRRVRVR